MDPIIQREDEFEIDLGEIFIYFLSKAKYILLTGVIFGVFALAITVFLIPAKYTSTTKFYVLNRQTNESITSSDIQSSTYLTNDYMGLSQSRTVIESVITKLDLDMSYEEVLEAMDVSVVSDTRIVSISFTSTDPYLAHDIANNIRIVASEHIQTVMNTEAVNVVDEANIPTVKSSPSITVNVLIAGVLGVVLAFVFYTVIFLSNDKITTTEDIERYLGLSIIGVLPLEKEEVKASKSRKKKQKLHQNVTRRTAFRR